MTSRAIRYRSILRFLSACIVLLSSLTARASAEQKQYLAILLKADGGAPSAKNVVDSFAVSQKEGSGASQPLLSGLSAETPSAVTYLLPIRAQGAFQQALDANPDLARAKLERYLLIEYPMSSDLSNARSAWQADPDVADVDDVPELDLGDDPGYGSLSSSTKGSLDQWGREALKIDQAWAFNGGHSIVAVLDTGLSTLHPELQAFDAFGNYTGGNFLPAASVDWGEAFFDGGVIDSSNIDLNVDEAQPVTPPTPPDSTCDPDGDGDIVPARLGHGTHVSGIVAANALDGTDVNGVCRHCSIWMQKYFTTRCVQGVPVFTSPSPLAGFAASMVFAVDFGAAVVNLSAGFNQPSLSCANPPDSQITFACLALEHAEARNVLVVASSGNDGDDSVDFPARDPRVVAVGGIQRDLSFWNDCPGFECGSNYGPNQELVAPAKDVRSTFYAGFPYVPEINCTDQADGTLDGYGPCTGTSMSAPHVSGLFGILRSTNPLVANGDPASGGTIGLRDVVATTTLQAQQNTGFGQLFGWGIPDAELAVRTVLGSAKDETVLNRATPLFTLRHSLRGDFVSVSSPQLALGLIQAGFDQSSGFSVPNYPFFPTDQAGVPAPLAYVYILTTPRQSHPNNPLPVLLYRMVRQRADGGNDFFHVASASELEAFKASDGAQIHGTEGYIYSSCTGQPGCVVPADAVPLYRAHDPQLDDYALVSGDQLGQPPFSSYTSPPQFLGYAIEVKPNGDSDADGDGLIDGFERILGTDPASSDSDCDGISDGVEFPLTGVSTSDPLDGCNLLADLALESEFMFNQITVSLVNHGPDAALDVVVDITWSSSEPSDTFQPSASECVQTFTQQKSLSPGGSFTCTFDRMENGESIDLYSWTTVSMPHLQVNATIVSSLSTDPNP